MKRILDVLMGAIFAAACLLSWTGSEIKEARESAVIQIPLVFTTERGTHRIPCDSGGDWPPDTIGYVTDYGLKAEQVVYSRPATCAEVDSALNAERATVNRLVARMFEIAGGYPHPRWIDTILEEAAAERRPFVRNGSFCPLPPRHEKADTTAPVRMGTLASFLNTSFPTILDTVKFDSTTLDLPRIRLARRQP